MQELETRSEQVTKRNKELQAIVAQLREESMFLRNQLLAHGNCNCSMVVSITWGEYFSDNGKTSFY